MQAGWLQTSLLINVVPWGRRFSIQKHTCLHLFFGFAIAGEELYTTQCQSSWLENFKTNKYTEMYTVGWR